MEPRERRLRVGLLIDRWDERRGGAERALFQLAHHLVESGHEVGGYAASCPPMPDASSPVDSFAHTAAVAGNPRPSHAAPSTEPVRSLEPPRVEPGATSTRSASSLIPVRIVAPSRGWTRGARERRLGEHLVAAAERDGCDVTVGVRHLSRVDVLWPHGGAHAVAYDAMRCARAGRELDARKPGPWSRHRAFIELERIALEGGARRVVCVSELVRAEFERLYPYTSGARARFVTIPNGVDLDRFHPRERAGRGVAMRRSLGATADVRLLGCAAHNAVLKGVPTLLDALARLAPLGVGPWTCVIAGPRDTATWERRARALGLDADRVRVIEHLDARAFAAACDLAVLPTWRDTSGSFVLEALASGTPVITTARAGASVCVRDPAVGTVLDRPGDADALAAAIGTWITRIAGGAVETERVRSSVANRSSTASFAAMERLLLEVAAEKRVESSR